MVNDLRLKNVELFVAARAPLNIEPQSCREIFCDYLVPTLPPKLFAFTVYLLQAPHASRAPAIAPLAFFQRLSRF